MNRYKIYLFFIFLIPVEITSKKTTRNSSYAKERYNVKKASAKRFTANGNNLVHTNPSVSRAVHAVVRTTDTREVLAITEEKLIRALNDVGCLTEQQDPSHGDSHYRFKFECWFPNLLKAIKNASGQKTIDIEKKTSNTISPRIFHVAPNQVMDITNHKDDEGIATAMEIRVFIKNERPLELNDLLVIDKEHFFIFTYKKDRDESKDTIKFQAQSAKSKFIDKSGAISCNFVVTKSMEQDFHFTFTLSETLSISSNEFSTFIFNHQNLHANNVERQKYILPDELKSFQIQGTVIGYLSEEKMWQIYIGKNSFKTMAVNNNNALINFEKTADRHGIGCSNNAFEGEISSACARVMITDEEHIPALLPSLTDVGATTLSNLPIYQSGGKALVHYSEVGIPIFITPNALDFEGVDYDTFLNAKVYIEGIEGPQPLPCFLPKGVYLRFYLEKSTLKSFKIDTEKYETVLVDFQLEKQKVTIRPFPHLNGTGKVISSFLSDGILKTTLAKYVNTDRLMSLKEITIGASGRMCVLCSFANGFPIVDEIIELRNTTFNYCQQTSTSPIEISGSGNENIYQMNSDVQVKKHMSSDNWYLQGPIITFDLDSMVKNMFKQSFMNSNYEDAFPNCLQMRVTRCQFTVILVAEYMFLDCFSYIDEKEVNIQLVFKYNLNQLAMTIEQRGNVSINKMLQYLYRTPDGIENEANIFIGPIDRVNRLRVSFQVAGDFYDDYAEEYHANDKVAIGKDVETYTEQIALEPGQVFTGGIMMCAEGLFLKCDYDTGGEPCEFLQQWVGANIDNAYTLQTKYCGVIKPKEIKIKGKITRPLNVADQIRIEGTSTQPLVHLMHLRWGGPIVSLRNTITGFVCFGETPRQVDTPVKIVIQDGVMSFSISPPLSGNSGIFLSVCNVKEFITEIWQYTLPSPADFHYIQFRSDLHIGFDNSPAIEVPALEGMYQQHVYGDRSKNRFFSCLERSKSMFIRTLFQAFGRNNVGSDLARNCQLKEICFTYHQDVENDWVIKSQGLTAKQGLWAHGVSQCRMGNPNSNAGAFVDLKIKFGTEISVHIEIPPIIVGKKEDVNGNTNYALSLTKSEKAKQEGPTIELIIGTSTMTSGTITGHIECVGYVGTGKLKINSMEPLTVEFVAQDQIKTGNQSIVQGFSMEGTLSGQIGYEDSELQFKIDGNSLIDSIKNLFTKTVEDAKTKIPETIANVEGLPQKIQEEIGKYVKQADIATREIKSLTKSLDEYQNEFRIKRNALRRKCSGDCNLVHTPGFKWDNKCKFSKSLSNSTCLKFSKDAHVAGDIHCVAKCDIQQAETRAILNKKYHDAKTMIKKRQEISDINSIIKILTDRTLTHVNELMDGIEELAQYKLDVAAITTVFQLIGMETESTDIKTEITPLKLDFLTSIEGKDNEKRKYLVDGKLSQRIADDEIRRRYGTLFDDSKNKAADMERKYQYIMNEISLWRRKNRDFLEDYGVVKRAGIPFDGPHKNDAYYVDPYVSSLNTPEDISNHMLVKRLAPWNVLKRHNPLKTKTVAKKTANYSSLKHRGSCHDTRSKVEHFNDMVGYMKSWTQSYTSAKRMESDILMNIKEGSKILKFLKEPKRSTINGIEDITDVTKEWTKTINEGFAEWGAEFRSQLHILNTMGPKTLKDDLKAMFVPDDSNSLESYIEEVSRKADVAFKKSFISNVKPFQGIAKNFMKHLTSNHTLEQLAPLIDEWDSMISKVDKRTISCHDEL